MHAAAADESLQSCPTLCDPIDGSPPGSPTPGILQGRALEWAAISFSNAWSEKWKWSRSVMSDSSRPRGLQPTRLLCLWDFPGKSTGVGCHCLLLQCIMMLTPKSLSSPDFSLQLQTEASNFLLHISAGLYKYLKFNQSKTKDLTFISKHPSLTHKWP